MPATGSTAVTSSPRLEQLAGEDAGAGRDIADRRRRPAIAAPPTMSTAAPAYDGRTPAYDAASRSNPTAAAWGSDRGAHVRRQRRPGSAGVVVGALASGRRLALPDHHLALEVADLDAVAG